ncbi:unnamed protein product [Symbiodinium necroappetens]|uniref:Uncharacterized protein n=1 Tax=Symbiodinium necroappetens TaxID=1628268 RepID=A0A812V5J1_9DINO|nr:unnamed protein product [Symbiodinium necroappetens]
MLDASSSDKSEAFGSLKRHQVLGQFHHLSQSFPLFGAFAAICSVRMRLAFGVFSRSFSLLASSFFSFSCARAREDAQHVGQDKEPTFFRSAEDKLSGHFTEKLSKDVPNSSLPALAQKSVRGCLQKLRLRVVFCQQVVAEKLRAVPQMLVQKHLRVAFLELQNLHGFRQQERGTGITNTLQTDGVVQKVVHERSPDLPQLWTVQKAFCFAWDISEALADTESDEAEAALLTAGPWRS